jgi:hypothetical protein
MPIEPNTNPGQRYAVIATTLTLGALAVIGLSPKHSAPSAALNAVNGKPSESVPGTDSTATTGHGSHESGSGAVQVAKDTTTTSKAPHIVMFTVDDLGEFPLARS